MTATALSRTVLPVCPPLGPGESLTSWTQRIAHTLALPYGLTLARLGLADDDRHSSMPTDLGLRLTSQQAHDLALITSTPVDLIRRTVLLAYQDGPLSLTGLTSDTALTGPLNTLTRSEWVHLTRSAYCPDCLRETDGVWQLAWRLPWMFACQTHRLLLATACPECDQPAGLGRGDRTLRPHWLALIPDPTRCGNPTPGITVNQPHRPGRSARPCSGDLTATVTRDLSSAAGAVVLDTQDRLHRLLDRGGEQATWRNVRALTTVLLTVADQPTLHRLHDDLATTLLTDPALAAALTRHEEHAAARADEQSRLRAGGGDHRTGRRQRHGTATPADPALVALLAPFALAANGPHITDARPGRATDAQDVLDRLAVAVRTRRLPTLPNLLAGHGATDPLITLAETAARRTGRFSDATTRPAQHVPPDAIPAWLWEEHAQPFQVLLPGVRPDTVRKFTSLYLIKAITGNTWTQPAQRLGHPTGPIPTLAANTVNKMTRAGTQAEFHHAADRLLTRLADGTVPLVNYSERRQTLRSLRTIPADVLRTAGLTATTSRRDNSAAWLWATLTGGHPHHAPAWGRTGITDNQKEVYRRWTRRDLPALRAHLLAHGQALLAVADPAQRSA